MWRLKIKKRHKKEKKKRTQRWTGQSEWRGNRAVGLLLHSGTFSTTTTTHTGMTHVYAGWAPFLFFLSISPSISFNTSSLFFPL